MAFTDNYIPLFKVNIFHLYFLNKGTDAFTAMDDEGKAKQLILNNINSYFNVIPSAETFQQIKGHNLIFKILNSGFVLLSKIEGNDNSPFISLDDDLSFTFLLQLKDPLFYNYTSLKMENAGKIYYLSNRKHASEAANFPLIKKGGGNTTLDEKYILSDEGQKLELKRFQTGEKNSLFALMRIFMKGDNSSLNITGNNGEILSPSTVFEVGLNNRKTTWRYIFKTNQQVKGGDDVKKEDGNSKILITKTEQQLTQNGFISIELDGVELPNPDARLIKPDTINNKYYSEIYM